MTDLDALLRRLDERRVLDALAPALVMATLEKPGSGHAGVLIAVGYRRTSRKYGMVSRIDRPDWLEHMIERRHGGHRAADYLKFVRLPEEERPEEAIWVIRGMEDSYRRGLSKDTLEITPSAALLVPRSGLDSTGYVEIP